MKSYYFLINHIGCGGAERQILNTIKEHLKLGEIVYLFTLSDKSFYDVPEGVKYIPLSHIKNYHLYLLCTPILVRKFKKYIEKYQLDEGVSFLEESNIVHLLSKKNAYISLRTHISIYDHFGGFLGLGLFFWKLMIKLFYPKAGKIIVNSRESKMDLLKYLKIDENKVEVLYNYIDKDEIRLLKNEKIGNKFLKNLKNKKVYITTGRLVRQKKYENIISALYIYNKKYTDWIYLIIGAGKKEKKLKELSKKLGIYDKILFLGEQKNVFKYLNIADVFLYVSDVEGLPNVLLEARELGLKIITNDFKSGAREIILGEDTSLIGKKIKYPFYGKYGILIDSKKSIEQLSNLLEGEVSG